MTPVRIGIIKAPITRRDHIKAPTTTGLSKYVIGKDTEQANNPDIITTGIILLS